MPGFRPVAYGNGVDFPMSTAWRGREVDVTGYYCLGERYYDPISGQWLSYDPLWNAGDPNGQSFCGGDPVNGFDPNGKCGVNVPPNLSTTINPNVNTGTFITNPGEPTPWPSLNPNLPYTISPVNLDDQALQQNLAAWGQAVNNGTQIAGAIGTLMTGFALWNEVAAAVDLSEVDAAIATVSGGSARAVGGAGDLPVNPSTVNPTAPATASAVEETAVGETAIPKGGPRFAAGTKVSTPTGDVDIEDIKTGDTVYAYDFRNGKVVEESVEAIHQNFTYHWVKIEIDGDTIRATKSHPFWVENENRWFRAVDLKAGMEVHLQSGKVVAIRSVEVDDLDQPETTYNFEVAHQHNYFVGESCVLVHNGPSFIVTANGTVFPVPNGAVGPGPVNSGNGFSFTGGSGGNGLSPQTTGLRIMDPTPQYPNGYGVYMNSATPTAQTVNPYTGQTISRSDPFAHIPCN